MAAALLAHAARTGALRPGLTLIGDKGFAGRDFEDLATAGFGLHLVRPDRRDEAPRHGSIGWIRQWIESVNDTLKGQLDLERHGGRTTDGIYARITQRLLAMAVCVWHNWAINASVKRSAMVGWAGYGYCAAHSRWYWGLKLYVITTRTGCRWPGAWPARRSANAKPLPNSWPMPPAPARYSRD